MKKFDQLKKHALMAILLLCANVIIAQPGDIDLSFDPGSGPQGGGFNFMTHVVQPDGKYIIGGDFTTYQGIARNGIARINSDGSIDPSFDPGTGIFIDSDPFGFSDEISCFAIQSDGKIIVGGSISIYNGASVNDLIRLNTDGTLDLTFNAGNATNGTLYWVDIQSDGKILVSGAFNQFNGSTANDMVRLNPNGTIDLSFSSGNGATNFISRFSIRSDGKIYIGNSFSSYNGTAISDVALLNADGTLDPSFNPGGGHNAEATCIKAQPDGKLVVSGNFTEFNGIARKGIARLNLDGSVDLSFDPGVGGTYNLIRNFDFQADGKIIGVGLFDMVDGQPILRIARYNTDGTLDTSFDPESSFNGEPTDLSVLPDGNIFAVGSYSTYQGISRNNLVRILGGSGAPVCDPPTVTTTATNESCAGGNGSVTVNSTGGSGSFTYSLDGGSTTQASNVFTNLAAGPYSITVVVDGDAECTVSTTATVSGGVDNSPTIDTCPEDVTVIADDTNTASNVELGFPEISDDCTEDVGNGLDFDGIDDYVSIPNLSSALNGDQLTISGWVYPRNAAPSFPDFDGFFGWRNESDADFYILQLTATTLEARFRNSNGQVFDINSSTLSLNEWQHFALTYDGTILTLYRNGVDVGSTAASGELNTSNFDARLGSIGFQSNGFNLDGKLDEVRFWNVARSQADILSAMNLSLESAPGLVASYRLNQGVANGDNTTPPINTLMDATGNGSDGDLLNMSLSGTTSNWVGGAPSVNSTSVSNNGPSVFALGNTAVTWTVTNAAGNIATCTHTVTVNSACVPPTVTATVTNETCAGGNGSITVNTSGGSGSFTYSLDGGTTSQVSNVFFGLTAASYTVTVVVDGDLACTSTVSATVGTDPDNIPPTITCSADVTISNTPGECTGTTSLVPPTATDNCSALGNALKFDGTNDYVQTITTDVIPISGEYTVSLWAKETGTTLLLKEVFAQSVNCFFGHWSTGKIRVSTSWDPDIPFPTDNQWHHYTIVRKLADTELYIDGLLVIAKGSSIPSPQPNNALYLGRQFPTFGEYFNGAIDDFQVWDYARTGTQIQAEMNAQISMAPGLLASYSFDQGVADGDNTSPPVDVLQDGSGNGNDGTLNNFTLNGVSSNWVSRFASTVALSNDAPAVYPIGATTVTWTATDGAGLTATCSHMVTVNNTEGLDCGPCGPCPADITGDGIVDILDFLDFNSAFGASCNGCPEDINCDGVVDISDFLELNSAFNSICEGTLVAAGNPEHQVGISPELEVALSGIDELEIHPELKKLIEDLRGNFQVALFPNPNKGEHINLDILRSSESKGAAVLRVMNAIGQQVLSRSIVLNGAENRVAVTFDASLEAGLYLLTIDLDGETKALRFVVE